MREIKESDWKILKELHKIAIDRFCQRILREIESISSNSSRNHHERYLNIFSTIQHQDKELGRIFDNLRRSTALIQLFNIQAHNLLSKDEFLRFSPETRSTIEALLASRA